MKIGIIGCGRIGRRRALAAKQDSDQIQIVADVDESRAAALASELDCTYTVDYQEVINRDDLKAVVVSTPNKFLAPVSTFALQRGKHVLCEKPPGRNTGETEQMVSAAQAAGRLLKIGFNHRHHLAIREAREVCRQGMIGQPLFIRAVYGHGGRPGYDREWRASADLAGGGALLDQGVHLVDLCRWFLGEFDEVFGVTQTLFWNLGFFAGEGRRQLEDNAFVILRNRQGNVAQLQTSWTQWKNRFEFEVFGRDGYIRVEGLGGSYGTETLIIGRRQPESGPPIEARTEFPGPDPSWQAEWREFTSAIHEGRQPLSCGEDSLKTMRILDAIYCSAASNRPVSL